MADTTTRPQRESAAIWRWLWIILPLSFFVVAVSVLWGHTLDDAFISLQYARNWASGNGLVFNPGERVEGFSNPLWVMLLAVGGWLLGWLTWARILGLCCAVGALLLCGGWVRWLSEQAQLTLGTLPTPNRRSSKSKKAARHKARRSKARHTTTDAELHWFSSLAPPLAATALLATHPGTAYYAIAGLETPLFSLLVLAGVVLHLTDLRLHDKPTSYWCYGPLAAAAITRPEGPLLLLLIAAHRLILRWRADRAIGGRAWAAIAGALALPIGWLLFRVSYYDAVLPNTYYAKPATFLEFSSQGLGYLKSFFGDHLQAPASDISLVQNLGALGAILFGSCLLGLTVRAVWVGPLRREARFVLLICALYSGFILYVGGDWMARHRFFQAILPLLYLLPALGLITLSGRGRVVLSVLLLLLIAGQARHAPQFWSDLQANSRYDHAHRSQNNVKMARWIHNNLPRGGTIVSDEIGALGFYSGLRVIDQWGLVDRRIARILHKHHFNPYNSARGTARQRKVQQLIAEDIVRRNPDYVLIDYAGPWVDLTSYDARFINPATMTELYRQIQSGYVFVRAFSIMTRPAKSFLLFRRNIPRTRLNSKPR